MKLLLADASLPNRLLSLPHNESQSYTTRKTRVLRRGQTHGFVNDSCHRCHGRHMPFYFLVPLPRPGTKHCVWQGQAAPRRVRLAPCVQMQPHGWDGVCLSPGMVTGVSERERPRPSERNGEEVCKNEGEAPLAAAPNWTEQVSS